METVRGGRLAGFVGSNKWRYVLLVFAFIIAGMGVVLCVQGDVVENPRVMGLIGLLLSLHILGEVGRIGGKKDKK